MGSCFAEVLCIPRNIVRWRLGDNPVVPESIPKTCAGGDARPVNRRCPSAIIQAYGKAKGLVGFADCPEGARFAQSRATPWGHEPSTHRRPNGPILPERLARWADRWARSVPFPRAMPWAGRTAGPLAHTTGANTSCRGIAGFRSPVGSFTLEAHCIPKRNATTNENTIAVALRSPIFGSILCIPSNPRRT